MLFFRGVEAIAVVIPNKREEDLVAGLEDDVFEIGMRLRCPVSGPGDDPETVRGTRGDDIANLVEHAFIGGVGGNEGLDIGGLEGNVQDVAHDETHCDTGVGAVLIPLHVGGHAVFLVGAVAVINLHPRGAPAGDLFEVIEVQALGVFQFIVGWFQIQAIGSGDEFLDPGSV